ncbi:MAG TPA: hydrolase [Anaeromyxobacteraceae bacterium]|nr:hydrolase [Anaeromyxobacteraceae bacterium]
MSSLELRPTETALVVIDLQKGIVAIETAPRPAPVVVGNAARLAHAMRERGGLVVLVRVAWSADGRDALRPVLDPGAPAAPGARPPGWAEVVPELAGHAGDHLVTKRQWGAFYGTDLDLQLRRRGISTVVLCGISTCFGVESTARDAFERGFEQVFVEDAMASRSAAEHEHTVTRVFPRMGRVRSTDQVLAALRAT